MPGSGTLTLKAAALMLAVGAPRRLAGATLALMLIPVLMELHQGRVLKDIARAENRAREKNWEIF